MKITKTTGNEFIALKKSTNKAVEKSAKSTTPILSKFSFGPFSYNDKEFYFVEDGVAVLLTKQLMNDEPGLFEKFREALLQKIDLENVEEIPERDQDLVQEGIELASRSQEWEKKAKERGYDVKRPREGKPWIIIPREDEPENTEGMEEQEEEEGEGQP